MKFLCLLYICFTLGSISVKGEVLSIKIVDANGVPLEEAVIEISRSANESKTVKMVTDKTGIFSFTLTKGLHISVEKKGYEGIALHYEILSQKQKEYTLKKLVDLADVSQFIVKKDKVKLKFILSNAWDNYLIQNALFYKEDLIKVLLKDEIESTEIKHWFFDQSNDYLKFKNKDPFLVLQKVKLEYFQKFSTQLENFVLNAKENKILCLVRSDDPSFQDARCEIVLKKVNENWMPVYIDFTI